MVECGEKKFITGSDRVCKREEKVESLEYCDPSKKEGYLREYYNIRTTLVEKFRRMGKI